MNARFRPIAALAIATVIASTAEAQQNGYDRVLDGALDLHAHVDPDGYGPFNSGRSIDYLDLAELASAAGMRGFVIKQHYDQTADSASTSSSRIRCSIRWA
jgi:hypothetical protein